MLDAMMQAKVGDDVFREDPTINLLEKKMAVHFRHGIRRFGAQVVPCRIKSPLPAIPGLVMK